MCISLNNMFKCVYEKNIFYIFIGRHASLWKTKNITNGSVK